MSQRIIYKNVDGSVGVLIPSPQALAKFGIDAIAAKDTPAGLSYWIVDETDIPAERTYRNAWAADETALGAPHGVGSASNSF